MKKQDIAIIEFLDKPKDAQKALFAKMGYELQIIQESITKATIFFKDEQGKERKWFFNKKGHLCA